MYYGYEETPASSALCRPQALRNIAIWYRNHQSVFPVWPTGTVVHPRENGLVGSFNLPLIFGRPVIVIQRYIHILVRRRTQRWTEHWSRRNNRRAQRLRRLAIDTDRQRSVIGNGIFAPRGHVVYTAGPRVEYTDLVVSHLRALIRGEVNDWSDPVTSESLPITTSEPIVQ